MNKLGSNPVEIETTNLDERIDFEKKPSMDVVMKTPDGELRVVLELEHRLRILKRKNPVFIPAFNCLNTTQSKKPQR